ncbi:MAG: hypothetical protein DMD96_31010 [Candidatus Rokuibacteriota bacterium]|nr:MAG: hypothetical protein DMD96_31010 [Candidatus Rokubacteria bacterium]
MAPRAARGPLTLTPSISVSEEYNDNIFSDNRNRESDFITTFSPALTLLINRPAFQLRAGYSFGADIYARESQFNKAFNRQNFVVDGFYNASSVLTLSVSESFAYTRDTSLTTQQGFSTGRQESWSNTFTPGMTWQMTSLNSLRLSASYSALRFIGEGTGRDSDTYGFLSTLTHTFTPRFSGLLGYGFTYLDPDGEDTSKTHTPSIGLTYLLTSTLTASVSGGPAITEVGNETIISPAGTVSLVQLLSFGSVALQYTRGVSVAGGFGGTTDTQTGSGTLALSSLYRGLLIMFTPSYSVADSLSSRQTEQVEVKTLTLALAATYQIGDYISFFGGYTFLRQRTGGSSSTQFDVDQNRVRFGVQFGYPFNFN